MLNLISILPEFILTLAGCAVMLLSPFLDRAKTRTAGYLSALGLLAAGGATVATWGLQRGPFFGGMVLIDEFSQVGRLLLYGVMFFISLAAIDFLQREQVSPGEFYALFLFVAVGASMMIFSADLILLFLGIEILSIGTYILAGFKRDDLRCTEASLKYFLLGAFSTSFLLYGVALLYGKTGSTRYVDLAAHLQGEGDFLTFAGLALVLVGFGFKIAMVPFHIWTPDVYEGAPTPVTAFMSVGSKAAAFLGFVRVFYVALAPLDSAWAGVLWIAAVLTMFVGNITALIQDNIKRLLAYSSIAHAGYILVGFVADTKFGVQAVLFYTLSYSLMNLGAFSIVQLISRTGDRRLSLQEYIGLGRKHPLLAFALSLFLFSLAGIPTTAGFMGKLFLFSAAIQNGLFWLVVLAVLNSAIAAYYYIRIVVLMYMREPPPEQEPIPVPPATAAVILVSMAGTMALGFFPQLFMHWAEAATAAIQ
jgi:NADH-quinone oxidoreductase subunit N